MDDSAPVRSSAPVIPQRRAHHEVIDVDELDDHRPSRRSRLQVPSSENRTSSDIIVLDSDDGLETGPSTQPRPTGGRFRSPPPPIQTVHAPPPVPPLPPRHRPRQQTRAFLPDVIRPNVEPFAFERAMVAHMPRPASHPHLGDASRPRPIISLGGGFVSLSNRREAEAELLRHQQVRDQARQRYFDRLRIARGIHQRHGFLSQTIGRIFPTWLFGDPTEEEIMDALAFSDLNGSFDFGDDRAPRRTPHEYRVAYTHPYPPAPGFTHNFESPSPSITVIDVDEEPGPSGKPTGSSSSNSTSENMNTLVCARCLDPLVLGGSSMSEDERTRRRLWSLRCGHMLDGKCMAELMKPRPPPDIEPVDMEVAGTNADSRIRGKNPSVETPLPVGSHGTVRLDAPESSECTTKTRGKARAVERQPEPPQLAEDSSEPATSVENSSIRSRLRPRNMAGHVTHTSSSSSTSSRASTQSSSQRTSGPVHPAPSLMAVSSAASQTKRRPKGKGKQKVVEPLILGRHEWRCPVALCERLHLSLNVETQGWLMDETQGAIPIFA